MKLSKAHYERLSGRILSREVDVLREAASDESLTEELALSLLARRDLDPRVLDALSRNGSAMKHRKVITALVRHPRTPRHVTIPIVRRLFTFELMEVSLTPATPADIKRVTDDALISRLETISAGERLSLARRASGAVAAALLLDPEVRVVEAALANPRMTEMWLVQAVMHPDAPAHSIQLIAAHPAWSLRQEVRAALLRNQHTPLGRVLVFAQAMPTRTLRDILAQSRLLPAIKSYLQAELDRRDQPRQRRAEAR
jgi:hypothetical protein